MPRLRERLAQQRSQSDSFPASTGQDSCRRAVKIVDIDHTRAVLLGIDNPVPVLVAPQVVLNVGPRLLLGGIGALDEGGEAGCRGCARRDSRTACVLAHGVPFSEATNLIAYFSSAVWLFANFHQPPMASQGGSAPSKLAKIFPIHYTFDSIKCLQDVDFMGIDVTAS